MTSYDLLEYYDRLFLSLSELDTYSEELKKLSESLSVNQDRILTGLYMNTPSSQISIAQELKDKIIKDMQKFSLDFDLLHGSSKILEVKANIEKIFEDAPESMNNEKQKIMNLIGEYTLLIREIYDYVRIRQNGHIVKLIKRIQTVTDNYDSTVYRYESIKEFVLKTENKLEKNEGEEFFKLQFFDENIKYTDLYSSSEYLNESYEILCSILDISLSEYTLKIVKVETGSLFQNLLGSATVLGVLSFLTKKIVEIMYNKYTFEGKVLRTKQIFDLVKADQALIEKYKELGIDIDFKEEDVEKTHYMLVKSIQGLIGSNTRIKINDEELSLENSNKQKYLEDVSKNLLEEKEEK